MSNWADFVITAVKRGPVLGEISQVQIHEDRDKEFGPPIICLLYTSPSPRD